MWITKAMWIFFQEQLADAKTAAAGERDRADKLLVQLRGMRSVYEHQITTLRVGHAAAVARAHEAELAMRASQTTTEWLSSHVNAVEHNRAMLESHLLHTNPVAMSIDTRRLKDTAPSTTTVRDGEITGTQLDESISMDDVPDLLKGQNSLFEDIGDAAARRQGLQWGEVGEIVETR